MSIRIKFSLLLWCLSFSGVLLPSVSAYAMAPLSADPLLTTLRTAHPRLLLLKGDEKRIQQQLDREPLMGQVHGLILDYCARLMNEKPVAPIKIGKRLLDKSRSCLQRVLFLAYAYRMTQDQAYLKRAEEELLAVAHFPDWNPTHFLDVAEMSLAVAIGYDWLFDDLTADTRQQLEEALMEKAIKPSFDERFNWFLGAEHNWNQVCNAGLSFAALAIAEKEPEMAEKVLTRALTSIRKPMATYAPNGAYAEGFSYWEYGTSFNVLFLSALETALGSTYDLEKSKGFMQTAQFQEHIVGPLNWSHNWGDSGLEAGLSPAMFWFAAQMENPALLWNEKQILSTKFSEKLADNRLLPLLLVWAKNLSLAEVQTPQALQWIGGGASPVAFMRSAWEDPNALFVGFKTGSASVNHAHMDAGSFVMDGWGERWAMDFGMQNYNSLEEKGVDLWNRSQNSQRWEVFRYSNRVHNTLTVDDQLQRVAGYSKIDRWSGRPDHLFAISDLSDIYKGQLTQAQRGIAIIHREYVTVRDEVQAPDKHITLRWSMLTKAKVKILDKEKVSLSLNGKTRYLTFRSNCPIVLKTWDTAPKQDYDAPNPGTVLIGFEAGIAANEQAYFDAYLTADPEKIEENLPLAQWEDAQPALDTIQARVVADLLTTQDEKEVVEGYQKTIRPDGTWADIDYVDTSRTGFDHSRHLERLLSMARAYQRKGGALYQQADLKEACLAALAHWLRKDYRSANWWWNEIGTPTAMTHILLLLQAALSPEMLQEGLAIAKRANLEGFGARPGGDLIKIEGIMAKVALIEKDPLSFGQLVAAMTAEIKTTRGRGLQVDMSFHHRTDKVISTLSYGKGYAATFIYWANMLRATEYALPEAPIHLLSDYYIDGISRSMAFGRFPDPGAENRELSRKGSLAEDHRGLAKTLASIADYRKKELLEPGLISNRYFWHSHYLTHQRPAYFASVRMHSLRSNNMEFPHNDEGLKNHFFADGSLFITRTGKEYAGIFPLWDWRKIPGTTVVQVDDFPPAKELVHPGLTAFVGAVTDGQYGASAFDFKSPHYPLSARKAWFFFDKELVCLGADIRSTASYPVATTLNQSMLVGPVKAGIKRQTKQLDTGEHVLKEVSWLWHDSIAYVFTTPQPVHIRNHMASGNWRMLSKQATASPETVSAPTFTLWLDHGKDPQGASYSYISLPAASPEDAVAYTKNPKVEVLANTNRLQAVSHQETGISYVVFYEAGMIRLPDDTQVAVNAPCLFMLQSEGRKLKEIAVSDPTGSLEKLELQINRPIAGAGEQWKASWDEKKAQANLSILLPRKAYAGQSVLIKP